MTASTIFALSSGAGRAGIAVWRLSGPRTGAILTEMIGVVPPPRNAAYRHLKTSAGVLIDRGLVLWFPAPASFTGEDMAELHVHGGRAVARMVSDTLIGLGAEPALAGDFTRRAVLNGKLDLTEAEAVADLIDADTERQRVRAVEQSQGSLSRQVDAWRADLIKAAGYLETAIDFSEEDLPDTIMERCSALVAQVAGQMSQAVDQSERGERMREGLSVAIVGAPNVGKSSLLNQIAGRDAAIVSHVAGTTRDVIEVDLDLNGWPVILFDTAGLRDAEDEIEREGVRRARSAAARADLKLVVFDASSVQDFDTASLSLIDDAALVVVNKIDRTLTVPSTIGGKPVVPVSAATGQGVADLLSALEYSAESFMSGRHAGFGRARHRAALSRAVEALNRFDPAVGVELAAEEIRSSLTALAGITGAVLADDVLDVVFREFCIGK